MNKSLPLIILFLGFNLSFAQRNKVRMDANGMVFDTYKPDDVGQMTLMGISQPVRNFTNLSGVPFQLYLKEEEENDEHRGKNSIKNPNAQLGFDAAKQASSRAVNGVITPTNNIEGTDFAAALVNPPDVNGEVGTQYYVHTVNASGGSIMKIYNKTTGALISTVNTQTAFWNGIASTSLGDPVILYDQVAQRWVLVEMRSTGNKILMAASQTSDPTGAWYLFQFSTSAFPDFPKISIWNNAILMTDNENGLSQAPIYAINKTTLYAGTTTAILRFTVPFITGVSFQPMTPVDWDSSTNPVGAPIFLRMYDNAWSGSGGADHLELWNVNLDWVTPGNSNVSGPTNLNTSAFDSYLCASFNCTPQPGATNLLDSQAEYLNFRAQYRNFGTHESIVTCHVVNAGTVQAKYAGIRWYELRRTGNGAWTIYQQSTFAPDAKNRFVGSIGIDGFGNIALGYNLTSTIVGDTKFYSAFATGRLSTDPLNTMTFTEYEVGAGTHTMPTSTGGRTGDYYSISIDPVDNKTFWFTSHYAKTNTTWGTKIASFVLQPSTPSTITVGALPTSTPCANKPYNISFTTTGTFNSGNQFIAQISNDLGSFTSPVNIGTLTSTSAGTIVGTIPSSTTPGGAGYKMQIVSTNPVVSSTNQPSISIIPINRAVNSSTASPYEAVDNVTTSGTVNVTGNKTFKAGKSVTLNPNTTVGSGTVFSAKIEGCNY